MIVQCALLKCYTILQHNINIPLPPDQHHCSDEAKCRLGGTRLKTIESVAGTAASERHWRIQVLKQQQLDFFRGEV